MDTSQEHLSDEQVATLIQEGDKEKFGVLMQRYDKKLSRYGKKFLSQQENIDDIVQDVFISTFQNINNFDPGLKFSSWIYRIAHNAFVNGLKKHQRSFIPNFDFDTFLSHHVPEDETFNETEHEMMKKMIDQGLDELSPKYKEVIILHYLEELSYKELSDILQIPTGTVGIRVKRGKEALRKVYERMNIEKPYGTG
ncbi:MAG: RNA polymerase sigma factor [Patescibacteria group bacterium]